MLTSGFLAVLGEMWSSIYNIHQFRGVAGFFVIRDLAITTQNVVLHTTNKSKTLCPPAIV